MPAVGSGRYDKARKIKNSVYGNLWPGARGILGAGSLPENVAAASSWRHAGGRAVSRFPASGSSLSRCRASLVSRGVSGFCLH